MSLLQQGSCWWIKSEGTLPLWLNRNRFFQLLLASADIFLFLKFYSAFRVKSVSKQTVKNTIIMSKSCTYYGCSSASIDSALSTGAIVGIVIGCLSGVGILIGIIVCIVRLVKKKGPTVAAGQQQQQQQQQTMGMNMMYPQGQMYPPQQYYPPSNYPPKFWDSF